MTRINSIKSPIALAEARQLQADLARRVIREDRLPVVIRYVAGVDVGFEDNGTITRAAIAVLNFPHLQLVGSSIARLPTKFPYIPGYLSFREIPAILEAMTQLTQHPDLILCDGQGIAHPRRLGIAAHLGVLTNLPSIGVAKSRLCGHADEPLQHKGAWNPLIDGEEVIGAVLRSRAGVKPLYISIGHCISLPTAISYVMACTTRYRLPETTRHAHRLASSKIA